MASFSGIHTGNVPDGDIRNLIVLLLRIWSATIYVFHLIPVKTIRFYASFYFYGILILTIPAIIVMWPPGISWTIKHPVWLQIMFALLSSAVWHSFPWRLKHIYNSTTLDLILTPRVLTKLEICLCVCQHLRRTLGVKKKKLSSIPS